MTNFEYYTTVENGYEEFAKVIKEGVKNITTYEDILKFLQRVGDAFCKIYCDTTGVDEYTYHDILNWLCKDHQFTILTAKERKYLSQLIEPFRDRVECIGKLRIMNKEYITIHVRNEDTKNLESVHLPTFKENTAYIGMERNRYYTPKELKLFS